MSYPFYQMAKIYIKTGMYSERPDPPNRQAAYWAWDTAQLFLVDTEMNWVEQVAVVGPHTHDASDTVSGIFDLDRIPDDLIGKNADLLDGMEAADFAILLHTHDAADIVTGTIALARIPNTLTGKDADTVDGFDGADFALVAHTHDASDTVTGVFDILRIPDFDAAKITTGTLALARIPTTLTGKDADLLDGLHGSGYALVSHTHAHNTELTGLQGGTTGQYYHMTAAEHAALGGGGGSTEAIYLSLAAL